jgi:uncharacterized protein (DUF1778 family)
MKRMGRPPLSKQERKSHIIMVRVTREEHGQLERAAKQRGVPTSEFVRQAALRKARP